MNTYISIITLNVNGLNAPIKRTRVAEWIKKKKQEPTICCLQETHLRAKDTYKWKVRDGNRYFKQIITKIAGVAILLSDKTALKVVKRDYRFHCTMIKRSSHQEYITIVNP